MRFREAQQEHGRTCTISDRAAGKGEAGKGGEVLSGRPYLVGGNRRGAKETGKPRGNVPNLLACNMGILDAHC